MAFQLTLTAFSIKIEQNSQLDKTLIASGRYKVTRYNLIIWYSSRWCFESLLKRAFSFGTMRVSPLEVRGDQSTRRFGTESRVEGGEHHGHSRRIPRDIPGIERCLIYIGWSRRYKKRSAACARQKHEWNARRRKGAREGRNDQDTERTKGRSSERKRDEKRKGRRDILESYGPSTSRSNILANLCSIKINQTPSRSAVSGPRNHHHHQPRSRRPRGRLTTSWISVTFRSSVRRPR